MRPDRKGVMDLPVRLMVVFLVLSISVPVIMDAVEKNRDVTIERDMESQFARFADAVALSHYSGTGNMRTVTLDIPDGCSVDIGGEGKDAYSIRASYNGNVLVRYMEVPSVMLISDISGIQGKRTLSVTSVTLDGRAAAEVRTID